jgi:deoxyribodipyrimidine photo-lyase
MSSRRSVIMWFRRDLRLDALPALCAAAADGDVVPLFVDDPAFDRAGAGRRAYLRAALQALCAAMDGALVVRRGDPVDVVPGLAREVGAAAVHLSRDAGPYGRRRDAAVIERLRADGVGVAATGSPYAVMPGTVCKADGSPYRVFTPFSRAWAQVERQAAPDAPDVTWRGAPDVASDDLPAAPDHHAELPPVGAAAARRRWHDFLDGPLERYAADRDRPDLAATSELSADLRWGVVHPSSLLADLDAHRGRGAGRFATELTWREFYADVLLHQPESAWHNLVTSMDAMPLDTDAAARRRFERWASGTTGFPFVDAGMRQLRSIGWMHNRVRMVTASFLVKDLHLPWWWGAAHFLGHLVDGDLASNNHGWQWAAGTGTDAAPYFRVFNPTAQSEKFDPRGDYIRRWVPELADVGESAIHAPAANDRGDYPAPMVDHRAERVEALRRSALTR